VQSGGSRVYNWPRTETKLPLDEGALLHRL
jgi:hypothetical protein